MSEKSVGLVLLTEIPEMGLVVVLRERGLFNPEKMKPESWPGACQVTVHGKVEEGEVLLTALFREAREELGEGLDLDSLASNMVEISRLKKGGKEVVTFAAKIDSLSFFKRVRLGPESGSIRLLRKDEISSIVDITGFDKTTGVESRSTIAMFPDEGEAVAKAFAHFS